MADEVKVHCKSHDSGAIGGTLWLMGWLFSIGFLKLPLLKAVLGLVLWPYYLGAFFHK